ncbi:MAG: hypothetical protein Ct9H300mP23_04470 [Nitrospinota bacterium]|nr:MAG: hypothetical protein Ct9H300mP23_04470 [Nitrospinota bacterium]
MEKHLNIELNLKAKSGKFFKSIRSRSPQIFRLGWGADFPDPDNFMNLFITTSGNNRLRWANQHYDQLVVKDPR